MKDRLIGFYKPSAENFKTLWNKATFVLDANVLLNLYRYPQKARNDIIGSLEKLPDRIWLPFYAALEFERNRLLVIADQKRKFIEVRNVVEEAKSSLHSQLENLQLKKRHSSINVDGYLSDFDTLTKAFLDKLDKLAGDQKGIADDDEVRAEIVRLLSGKIGDARFCQDELNEIYKQGESRYDMATPPGYMDNKKNKSNEPDSFQYGGVVYKKKFGDLIIWKEVISYAKASSIKHLVLITDDDKDDWWWTVDSQGRKKIGPRPELVEEIHREGQVDLFYMYNSEQFLQYSKQYLNADVSEETIKQVREVRRVRTDGQSSSTMHHFISSAEDAVMTWLTLRHPTSKVDLNKHAFPDFIVSTNNVPIAGYELEVISDVQNVIYRIREAARHATSDYYNKKYGSIVMIIALESYEELEEAVRIIQRSQNLPELLSLVFGVLETDDKSPGLKFKQVVEFTRLKDLFNT